MRGAFLAGGGSPLDNASAFIEPSRFLFPS